MLWDRPTPQYFPSVPLVPKENIGHALGVGAVGDGMGGVVQEGEVGHLLILDGIEEGVNGAVSFAGYLKNSIGVLEGAPEGDMGVPSASMLS